MDRDGHGGGQRSSYFMRLAKGFGCDPAILGAYTKGRPMSEHNAVYSLDSTRSEAAAAASLEAYI